MGTLNNPYSILQAKALRKRTRGGEVPVEVDFLFYSLIGKQVETMQEISAKPDDYLYYCGVCGYQMIGISEGGECPVCGARYVVPKCKLCGEVVLLPLWRPCIHYREYGLGAIALDGHKVNINSKTIMDHCISPFFTPAAWLKSLWANIRALHI